MINVVDNFYDRNNALLGTQEVADTSDADNGIGNGILGDIKAQVNRAHDLVDRLEHENARQHEII